MDDLLPASCSTRKLHVTCRTRPSCYAYALIEKAYLKIMGGYDFPGSNSGTDLLALTGWIPEHVFLQSADISLGILWKRMLTGWNTGDVLITLGTGRTTKREERELGLIGEHDYAVLDIKENGGDRMMLVKNPWTEGTVWKGIPADYNNEEELGFGTLEQGIDNSRQTPLQPGVFWISLENISRNFASIYLNWNPSLFTHRQDTHFSWDLSAQISETSFGKNPQFALKNPSSNPVTVWIHLARHMGLSTARNCDVHRSGYISLYLFDDAGQKVYLSSPFLDRTPYVDSPQTLLRVKNFPAEAAYTLVVSSQDLSPIVHHFSLSLFSVSPVDLLPVTETHPYSLSINSAWTHATSGGNAHSADYAKNPQFQLQLTGSSSLILLLESANPHPVHVKLVHSGGYRITSVMTRDIIAESGEYKRSTAFARTRELPQGLYTAVASTFETGLYGEFVLTLLATSPDASFHELPSEGAGMFHTVRNGTWKDSQRLICWGMEVHRLTGGFIKAGTKQGRGFALRITVKEKRGRMKDEQVLVIGGFSDAPQGVKTARFDLITGHTYSLVLERVGHGDGEWEVIVVTDGPVNMDILDMEEI